jgi:hypothetical protein
MSATAPQRVVNPEHSVDPVYTTRDDLASSFNPANAHERMLVTAAAQAWQRLQRAYDLERRLLETTDLLDLFTSNPEGFKSIARHIAECERIWRRALEALERVKRSNAAAAKMQTASPRPRPRVITPLPVSVPQHRTPPAGASTPTRASPDFDDNSDHNPSELLKLT